MLKRPSPVVIAALLLLAVFTVWITRQAKALEQDLDSSAQKISLLDQPAPDFHSTALNGSAVSPSDSRGKQKLVLVFIAGWNVASPPEANILGQIYRNTRQSNPTFDMIGIDLDDDRSAAQQFVDQNKIPFPVVYDQGRSITNSFQIRSIPTLLLIDTDGKIISGGTGLAQRGQNDFARQLGLNPRDFRMEMREPNGGRGN